MGQKAAIYHFTDESQIRPIVYQKEIQRLQEFANSKGYEEADVYVDMSLRKCDQKQLQSVMEKMDSYTSLILKDFYHLRKNTGVCMKNLMEVSKKNSKVLTIEDGSFTFTQPPFDKPLKVAIYYCGLEIVGHSADLQYDIMNLFIKSKTKWKLIDSYADMSGNKVDGNQKELYKLIENHNKYELILVQSFGNIHWRTSKFCKIRHLLQTGIYSMQEDIYLPYEQEELL